MRRVVPIFIATLSVFILMQSYAQEPLTRSQIYDQWDELNLTTKTGDGSLIWLPEGMGYLESEIDSITKNHTYHKVNPENSNRSPLFDQKTSSKMVAEYNRLTEKTTTGLLFKSFTYLPDNSGIRFTLDDNTFIYRFEEEIMQRLENNTA